MEAIFDVVIEFSITYSSLRKNRRPTAEQIPQSMLSKERERNILVSYRGDVFPFNGVRKRRTSDGA